MISSRIGLTYLVQSRIDDAILWLEKARAAAPELGWVHLRLASAFGLKGETNRAAAENAEAQRIVRHRHGFSIARLNATEFYPSTKISALLETTYLAGLRKAGVPEE